MKGFLERDRREAGFKELQRELWEGLGGRTASRSGGLYFIKYRGRAVGSRVSQTASVTIPKGRLLLVAVPSFFAHYVHFAGEGEGTRLREESRSRASGSNKCWRVYGSWTGVPGCAPLAGTKGRLLAQQCKF